MGKVPRCQQHARALSAADLIHSTGGRPFILGIGRCMSPRIRSRFVSFLLRSCSFPSGAVTVATSQCAKNGIIGCFRNYEVAVKLSHEYPIQIRCMQSLLTLPQSLKSELGNALNSTLRITPMRKTLNRKQCITEWIQKPYANLHMGTNLL